MYCWNCGAKAEEDAAFCAKCGASLTGEQVIKLQPTDDKALGMILPVNVSPMAMISGYLGLFSVLLLPAPFAILTGILGMRDIKKNPNRSGKGRAIFGIVMGTLCTVGLFALIILCIAASNSGT